jgi:LmbE family N-acetylglucosaminyl deacetylase
MSGQNIAVIVAHPDDEVLAFGGIMCRHVELGDRVHVLFLATGLAARSENGCVPAGAFEKLRGEAREAGKLIGVSNVEFADFPDNRMDTVPLLDVVKVILAFVEKYDPIILYTHHIGDLNIDHSITARAVMTACRPIPGSRVQKIYAGEILSSSEYSLPQTRFLPNTYVPIESYIDRKRDALKCYSSEIRFWPHPRSIKAVALMARLRGSECGMEAAEALWLLRDVMPEIPPKN